MTTETSSLTLEIIVGAGVALMGILGGGLKDIAPPEMPKFWVTIATVIASLAFMVAKAVVKLSGATGVSRYWMIAALVAGVLAVLVVIAYVLTRRARTADYNGTTVLTGTEAEYLPAAANNPKAVGWTREEALENALGNARALWSAKTLAWSRRLLGIEYSLFIALFALSLYLFIESYNAPLAVQAKPNLAEEAAKLRDVHFAYGSSELSADALTLLRDDANVLKTIFKDFPTASVQIDGFCDENGSDEYNFKLGYERAQAVERALAGEVDEKRFSVDTHGKRESHCDAADEACRQQERHVHLVVHEM